MGGSCQSFAGTVEYFIDHVNGMGTEFSGRLDEFVFFLVEAVFIRDLFFCRNNVLFVPNVIEVTYGGYFQVALSRLAGDD